MTTMTLPPPTSAGCALDTSPECFGTLQSSADLVSDSAALRVRMQTDGYLYLPGFLNRSDVQDARDQQLKYLADEGHLDANFSSEEAVAVSGASIPMTADSARENRALMRILYSGRLMEFFEQFLGGAVRHFDYTWLRAVPPGLGTAPHMDIVYMGRGTTNLYTTWTPLGDVDLEMGGLMILEGAHHHEKLRQNYGSKDVDTYCSNRREPLAANELGGGGTIQQGGALSRDPVRLRERLGGRWLTAEFQMGDVLIFGMYTVHASLDNQSNRIRLSSDSRYQLASEPADERWIGENPVMHGDDAKRGLIC